MKPPFKFAARTRVGFSDTDAQGIVYYGRYNPYFDLARVEYLRRLGLLHHREDGMEFVMRANTVEYFAPAVFDDEIEVFCRVARIGIRRAGGGTTSASRVWYHRPSKVTRSPRSSRMTISSHSSKRPTLWSVG